MTLKISSAAADSTVVVTSGAQTIAGVKTFSSAPVIGTAPMTAQSGTAPTFGARAYCSFNGSTTGTNAPTVGGNVATVTRNSTGDYTVTFTTAMPSASYSVVATTNSGAVIRTATLATGSVGLQTFNTSFAAADATYISVAIFC